MSTASEREMTESFATRLHLKLGCPLGIALDHAEFVLQQAQYIAANTDVTSALIQDCRGDIQDALKAVKELEPFIGRYVHESLMATAITEVQTLVQELVSIKYTLMKMPSYNPSSPVMNPSTIPHPRPNIKIPTIKIPIFEGKHEDWSSFWGTFEAVIDSDPTIPAVVKFNYLIICKGMHGS